MKLPVLLITFSLSANAALLTAFALRPAASRGLFTRESTAAEVAVQTRAAAGNAEIPAPPEAANGAAARAKLWSTLYSDDLKTLIARLRAAGFSPKVVRAIVTAEVDARYAPRRQALVGPATDQPFWKSEGFSAFMRPRYYEEWNQLYRDRAKAVRDALGDGFHGSSTETESTQKRRTFGDLPEAKITEVQRIADDYNEMLSQVQAATDGIMLPEDREKLALLQQEKRADLAAILSPQELAEYEMRTSPLIRRLGPTLTLMDATEAEFLAIYRIDQSSTDAALVGGRIADPGKRRESQQQRADQLKAALGEQRYADFARAGNREFQQLSVLAQQQGVLQEAAVRAFSLRDTVAAESNRIFEDRVLTPDQRRAALQALAQNTRAKLLNTLGSTAGDAYLQNARWLTEIENGGSVRFGPDGNISSVRKGGSAK